MPRTAASPASDQCRRNRLETNAMPSALDPHALLTSSPRRGRPLGSKNKRQKHFPPLRRSAGLRVATSASPFLDFFDRRMRRWLSAHFPAIPAAKIQIQIVLVPFLFLSFSLGGIWLAKRKSSQPSSSHQRQAVLFSSVAVAPRN